MHTNTLAATASDVDTSDGEDENGMDEAGMQVAVRERDGPSDHSEDEEAEGEEMEVLDPSHVSSASQTNVFVCTLVDGVPILSPLTTASNAKGAKSSASPADQAE